MPSISSRAADICDEFELSKEESQALQQLALAIEKRSEDLTVDLGFAYNALIELITKYGYDIDRGMIVKNK